MADSPRQPEAAPGTSGVSDRRSHHQVSTTLSTHRTYGYPPLSDAQLPSSLPTFRQTRKNPYMTLICIGRPTDLLSGVELIQLVLKDKLDSRGEPATWISLATSGEGRRGSISWSGLKQTGRGLLAIADIARKSDSPSVLYYSLSQGGTGLARDVVLVLFARAIGIKRIVAHLHGEYVLPPQIWKQPFRQMSYRLVGHLATRLISCVTNLTLAGKATTYISNVGILSYLKRNLPTPKTSSTSAADDERPRVGYLGTISAAKGISDLLSAAEHPDAAWRLRVVGAIARRIDPPAKTNTPVDPWNKTLTKLTTGDVDLLGRLGGQEKIDEMATWSVACFPSWSEGLPLAVLEARVLGVPVVATDVGDCRSLLFDSGTMLVPPRDPEALREAIEHQIRRERNRTPVQISDHCDLADEIIQVLKGTL